MTMQTTSMLGPLMPVATNFGALDDESLLKLTAEGSTGAFATICDRYERRLLRVAQSIVRNEADAEDIVQESLMRAFVKVASFRGEAGVYTWLVRIVMNTSLMLLRKRIRRGTVSLDHSIQQDESWVEALRHPGRDAETEVIEKEHVALLRQAVQNLPEHYRILLSDWMTGEQSTAELACKRALTVPATKSRLLRGRQRVEVVVRNGLRKNRASVHR